MGWLNYMQKNRFGVYEYKRRIPKELLSCYPLNRSGFIKFSLKTKDKNEAAIRNKQFDAQYELEFANLRQKNVVPPEVRKDFLRQLRVLGIDGGDDIDLLKLTDWLNELQEGQRNNEPSPAEKRTETIALSSILKDDDSIIGSKNRDLHYGRLIDTIQEMIKAFNGDNPDFKSIKRRYGLAHTTRLLGRTIEAAGGKAPQIKPGAAKLHPSLSQMIDLWLKERKSPPAPKTVLEWQTSVRRFEQLHGTLPVSQINKQHIRDFRDALRVVPARSNANSDFKALVVANKDREDDYSRLSPGTINKNLTAVKSLLQTAIAYEFIDANPAAKILLDENPGAVEKRLAFEPEDLKSLFHSPVYLGCASTNDRLTAGNKVIKDAYYWLPLLALFTGARQSEIAQLRIEDVTINGNGYSIISINAEAGKRIKTKSAKRIVPLHRYLAGCGFLAFVDQAKANGNTWLFPELLTDKTGISAKSFSRWFAKFCDSRGITDSRKDFHSLRHTFKRYAREVMSEEMHDALTGHTNSNVGRRYGSGFPLETLIKGVQAYNPPLDVRPLWRAGAQNAKKK